MRVRNRVGALVGLCVGLSCSDDGGESPRDAAAFPSDYAQSYIEVRDCRPSGDHDLNNIRILTDPDSVSVYRDRAGPFAPGSIVLKEEYEFDDDTCSGEIKQWTVMQKLAAGESADSLGWTWQQVDPERRVVSTNGSRCVNCHSSCDADGYDWTCAEP